MLTQRDLKLIVALDGFHRRRHFFLSLYLIATAIILVWLLGLGGPLSVTFGPYIFQPVIQSRHEWRHPSWMYAPLAVLVGWTEPIPIYKGDYLLTVSWSFWPRFWANTMLLLPLAAGLAVSLAWFVRTLVRTASKPSQDKPTLSQDAALAVPLGAPLCIGVYLLLMLLYTAGRWVMGEWFLEYLELYHDDFGSPYPKVAPILLWPISSAIAFVALRVMAASRRGALKPLHGLRRVMLFSALIILMLFPVFAVLVQRPYSAIADSVILIALFVCLVPLYWSLGVLIMLAYRWPQLRQMVTS